MKVLHVAETIKGGVGTVLNSLLEYQNDLGFKTAVIVPLQHSQELIKPNNTRGLYFNRTGRNIKSFYSLFRIYHQSLKDFKPDVIHLHSTFAGVICRFLLKTLYRYNVKVIYCPHAFSFIMKGGRAKKFLFAWLEKLLSFNTNKIICVSKYEKEIALAHGFKFNKLTVIYNGVNDHKLKRECKSITPDDYEILFVGRLDFQKGFDSIIRALKPLPALPYNINITVIGDSVNDKKNLEHIAHTNVSINYKGWIARHELGSYYCSSDFVVIPSRWEGFAMVPLEAMSFGVPLILSNIPPFRELVDEAANGIIFDLDNLSELSEIFMSLDKIDRDRLSVNGSNALRQKFTSTVMNENVVKLYNE
ncbi:TPA: glycosyltransferase family 4 protein [Klebsiella quasipneumoniae subsp. similipneumoniae]